MGHMYRPTPPPKGYAQRRQVPGWKVISDIISEPWEVKCEQVYHVDRHGPFICLTITDRRSDPPRMFVFDEPEATFPSNMLITQVMLLCG